MNEQRSWREMIEIYYIRVRSVLRAVLYRMPLAINPENRVYL